MDELPHVDVDELGYCTRCGHPVEPYRPSTVVAPEYGLPPEAYAGEPHYWCPTCQQRLLATNLIETGFACADCRTFMPLAASYCGTCGKPMHSGA